MKTPWYCPPLSRSYYIHSTEGKILCIVLKQKSPVLPISCTYLLGCNDPVSHTHVRAFPPYPKIVYWASEYTSPLRTSPFTLHPSRSRLQAFILCYPPNLLWDSGDRLRQSTWIWLSCTVTLPACMLIITIVGQCMGGSNHSGTIVGIGELWSTFNRLS